LLVTGMLVSLLNRDSFRVDVVRDRGVMARIEDGKVENVYRLQIMNATETAQHYLISATGLESMEVDVESSGKEEHDDDKKEQNGRKEEHDRSKKEHDKTILVKPAEALGVTVDLKIPDGLIESGSHKIAFVIKSIDTNETITEKSIFLVPR